MYIVQNLHSWCVSQVSFKLKYSQGSWRFLSLTENPKNCSLRSLPNMELLDKLKGQIPLKISKIFCRYSLMILMEKDATLKIC